MLSTKNSLWSNPRHHPRSSVTTYFVNKLNDGKRALARAKTRMSIATCIHSILCLYDVLATLYTCPFLSLPASVARALRSPNRPLLWDSCEHILQRGFRSVRENSDFGETVEQTQSKSSPQGAECHSPARQRQLKWKNRASPVEPALSKRSAPKGTARVLTHTP